jgi:hypothetical protein
VTGEQTIFSKSAGFQTVLNNKFGSYKWAGKMIQSLLSLACL